MIGLIVRRLTMAVILLVTVSALTFVLTAISPSDPAATLLGSSATPERVAALRTELGLNRPLLEQYLEWVGGALRGDFGTSWVNGQSVGRSIASGLPVTLSLVVGATLLAGVLGVALGIVSVLRGGVIGRAIDVLATLGLALPNFWLGWILVAVFAVGLRWLPATGYASNSFSDWSASLILPVFTLGVVGLTGIAKQTRDSMSETLTREYITAWRADGVPAHRVILRHGLRNSAIPILTIVGLFFIGALSGTVVVESIFAMPGLGSAAVTAARTGDMPTIQGVVVVLCIGVVIVNTVLDISYVLLSPKERNK